MASSVLQNGDQANILPKIQDALQIVHNAYSTAQARTEAQAFLEQVKFQAQAPSYGFTLASDKSQDPIIRHYGLSLLENSIKHKWAEYSEEEASYLRDCVLQLAHGVSADDRAFLRNKVATLWVEVAKRSWASDWMNMDELLVRLWQIPDSGAHKELVMFILEILSDEIFTGDDPVVMVREGALSKACVEVFTPEAVLAEAFPNRQAGPDVRCGQEGWITRISELLNTCLNGDVQGNDALRSCAVRALSVFYSLVPWVIPRALIASRCVHIMCAALASSSVTVQKASLEALHQLYSRVAFTDDEFMELVVPLYATDFIDLCRRLFEWSIVDANDIDDDKYQFSKKFSEMLACLGNFWEKRWSVLPQSGSVDVQGFLQLLLLVVRSQSLVVSIPVVVTWSRLLNHQEMGPEIAQTNLVGPLLELCGSRLIRFESLPEDNEDQSYLFLLEDTDTIPERHAFLGNYRRYSSQVIEAIVQLKTMDAMQHILTEADNVLLHLYDGQASLNVTKYSKTSMPVLRVDTQFTVIEAALKGYSKWRTNKRNDSQFEQQKLGLEAYFEEWCNSLLGQSFEDPLIRKRILQLLVHFSTTALEKNAGFMLKVLEHILVTWPSPQPEHRLFNEAIKDLQSESMIELQRLASKMPDHLITVYDQIEARVNEMVSSGTLDEKRQIAYQSFLFIIIHRSTTLDQTTKAQKLEAFVNPVKQQWQTESLKHALSSYEAFCELLALDKVQSYLAQRQVHRISDWGSVELDAEGQALQNELEERQSFLPLRSTKSFLTYSVEKVEKNTSLYQLSCSLWQDGLGTILQDLLQLLTHAHAAHNPSNWALLPPEMRSIVGRVLSDRFWQAGISEGSKDEFYARVMDKKNTLEGLASSIRGSVRFVRETCYAIIYCMSRLDVQFYGFGELPGPLAHALFANSLCLSPHQIINLLNLVRYLVDHCPMELRAHFLPPILATCFSQMDAKIKSEWENLDTRQGVQAAGDELTEEMKAESILRQLTYTAVLMVADFLDPHRPNLNADAGKDEKSPQANAAQKYPSLRKFCLMQSAIVEPLLMFCTHAIRMRDGRCCSVILRVFRSIVPEFHVVEPISPQSLPNSDGGTTETHQRSADEFPIPQETASAIREYVSSDVLKACIQSLHEQYFVDLQKELGSLIAAVLIHYSPLTSTPRDVLLSLPDMHASDVDQTIDFISRPGLTQRQQRAMVLDLLKHLKGVSISEMGKLTKSAGMGTSSGRSSKRPPRSKMAQEFMTAPPASASGPGPARKDSPDLEGVAGLFNA